MSSVTLEVGAGDPGAGLLYFSASQFTKFTTCENQWVLNKLTPHDDKLKATSDAMDLGSLMHTLEGAWWSGRPWKAAWLKALKEAVGKDVGYAYDRKTDTLKEVPGWEAPKPYLRALPIMEAWVEVHGASPAKDPDPSSVSAHDNRETLPGLAGAELIALELPFDLPIPGIKDARVRGFLDGLVNIPAADGVRVHDTTKILEFKTMGRWGKDARVAWDPQLPIYLWAAKQLFGVESAVFDAISTYDYKVPADATPGQLRALAEKRFRRIELPYDQRAIDRTLDDMRRVARRARQVLKNPGLAVRNVGDACTYCDHFRACLTPWET